MKLVRRLILAAIVTASIPTSQLDAQSSTIYSEMKEVYFEYLRVPLSEMIYFDYIGGHYNYFFSDHFAAGPGFIVPLFDFSDFLLGAYIHVYYYPFNKGRVLPFVYGDTGVTLSELKENMFFFGSENQLESEVSGETFYGSAVRFGVGVSAYLYEGANVKMGLRAMLYHSFFVHHFNRILDESRLTQVSFGFFWGY